MPTNHEYWHDVWEYGHTFAGLIVLPLTDPWVRKLLAYLKMVPGDSEEQALQKRLERESRQSLIERLTEFQNTSGKVDAAMISYISTTQALGMRLSHFESIQHCMSETLKSYTSTTQALGERLSHFDNSIEQSMSRFDENINRRVEEFELHTQQALNERPSRINQLETPTQLALIDRLRRFGLYTEGMPIEEALNKCLDELEGTTRMLVKNRDHWQHLQATVDELTYLVRGLEVCVEVL